jgi:hypothetical protein
MSGQVRIALVLHEKWRDFCLFCKSGNFLPVTGFLMDFDHFLQKAS